MISRQEIETRWRAGETLDQIATTFVNGEDRKRPVSKQAVSKRLLRMGYSPRERRYAEQAANGSQASADRLDVLTERAEQREAAAARLQALADELDLSPRALAVVAKGSGDLAERVREACGEWSPDYIAHTSPAQG